MTEAVAFLEGAVRTATPLALSALGEPVVELGRAVGVGDQRRVAELRPRLGEAGDVVAVRVGDEDPGMLRYLDSLGLRPGVEVRLTDRAPFDGPLTIQVGSTTQQVGAALASRVLVSSTAD